MKYFRPKSLTFWAGVSMLIKAIATSTIEKRVDFEGFIQAFGAIGIRAAIK